jgi:hypothetical protein
MEETNWENRHPMAEARTVLKRFLGFLRGQYYYQDDEKIMLLVHADRLAVVIAALETATAEYLWDGRNWQRLVDTPPTEPSPQSQTSPEGNSDPQGE